jgi:prepilin peptidase CpaA
MPSTSLAIGAPFVLIMVLAAASDVLTRRIPNAVTVAGILAAPVLWGLAGGPAVALASLLGGGLALVLGMILFALGALGGGDAKLLVVTGAFLGPAGFIWVAASVLVIGITGGALALALALVEGSLLATLGRAWRLALHLTTLGRAGAPRDVESPGALNVPYGVAIAAGSVLTWLVFTSALPAQ